MDVTELAPKLGRSVQEDQRLIMRWERSLMGVRSSPFNCVKVYLWSEETIQGDRLASNNVFRWDRVVFNLPGEKTYDPRRPWMYRYDEVNQQMASFVISYVDDLRTGAQSKRLCDQVTHVVASKVNYLGQQDAPRKRGESSQAPGAWAGSVIEARKDEGLYVSVSQQKWERVQEILRQLLSAFTSAAQADRNISSHAKLPMLNHKLLEQDTGFLVHVFMTYENLRPYLKGFYLTLNRWRYDRSEAGWKMGRLEWEEKAEEMLGSEKLWKEVREYQRVEDLQKGVGAPGEVRAVERLKEDVMVLNQMFQCDTPSLRLIRGYSLARILYGFGDASGAGFGSSWVNWCVGTEDEEIKSVRYRFGRWGKEGEATSSNYRELKNLVDTLETMGVDGELKGVEVFLFTDNSTAESAFGRGSSTTPALYDMVKRLKLLEMVHRARFHVVHVSGKRMIHQGTDGLSRGCLNEGVMRDADMLAFVPLRETAVQRLDTLLQWLQETSREEGDADFELLQPEDWYVRGHDIRGGRCNSDGVWIPTYKTGRYIWAPPPCVAAQCLEELRKARHKRQCSSHIFVCPRVMATTWQRSLYRSADLVIQLPAGHLAWPLQQHEPLFIGFYFPFLTCEPWQLRGTEKVLEMGGHLQRVCQTNSGAAGPLLQQLWAFTRKLSKVPEFVVQRMLQGTRSSEIPKTTTGKRRRSGMEKEKG